MKRSSNRIEICIDDNVPSNSSAHAVNSFFFSANIVKAEIGGCDLFTYLFDVKWGFCMANFVNEFLFDASVAYTISLHLVDGGLNGNHFHSVILFI